MNKSLFDYFRKIWKIPIMEQLLLKLTSGKEFGSIISKFPPNHYQYKPRTMRKATRNGVTFQLDISDMVDWFIYYGFKETARNVFYDLIEPGQTVIDIGSNVGEVCMNTAKRVGESGKVYAIEPHPDNIKRLKKNLSLNTFSNIGLHQVALGNQTGTVKMYTYDSGNLGMNRMLNEGEQNSTAVEVQLTTLDRFVSEQQIEELAVMKLDVEGYELKALQGAKETLRKFKPVIFMELDNGYLNEHGDNAADVIALLEGIGYEVKHSETGRVITSSTNLSSGHFDVLAKAV